MERLIATLDEACSLLVELAAYSGLRAGEIAGLQVRHLDTSQRSVRVQQTVVDLNGVLSLGPPKSKAGYRIVTDLDPDLCKRLAAHVVGKRSSDLVFGSRDDTRSKPFSGRRRVFRPC